MGLRGDTWKARAARIRRIMADHGRERGRITGGKYQAGRFLTFDSGFGRNNTTLFTKPDCLNGTYFVITSFFFFSFNLSFFFL